MIYILFGMVLLTAVYITMRVRQMTLFYAYLNHEVEVRHERRMELLHKGLDPETIRYHDVKACFNKLDNTWPWSRDFSSCEVFETWPCDY